MQNTAELPLHRITIDNNSDFVELAYARPDGSFIIETVIDENDLCDKRFKINNIFKLFDCKKIIIEYKCVEITVEQITSMQYMYNGRRMLGIVINDIVRKLDRGLVHIYRSCD